MIVKINKGRDAGRLLAYLYGPGRSEEHEDPRQVAGSTIANDDPQAVAGELRELAAERHIARPIHHASLRVRAEEASRLDDAGWSQVAEKYADRMGFSNSAWCAVRHADDHVHVVASRVAYGREVVPEHGDRYRAMAAAREIEAEHGLEAPDARRPLRTSTLSRGEREQRTRQREQGDPRGSQEAPRVRLRAILEQSRDRATSREDFEGRATRAGAELRPNESAKTGRMHGYSVSLPDWRNEQDEQVWLPASKVHKDLSWARLGPTLEPEHEREHERERDRGHDREEQEL
ncbi:MAG: relaxase/mobilization nuclease domain-containing protein [Solirubrobacteraceae bacterium]